MLRELVLDCLTRAAARLNATAAVIDVSRSDTPQHGDLSTNAALVLQRELKRPPREIAQEIVQQIDQSLFARVDVVGPGFINFTLKPQSIIDVLRQVLAAGAAYGRLDLGRGQKVQIEFVSANPTGPLTLGNGRGAAIGDALSRILTAAGFQVQREYYVNDRGTQVELLGKSVWARYRELFGETAPLPEEGYPGEYVVQIASEIRASDGDQHLRRAPVEVETVFAAQAVDWCLADIRRTLTKLGVHYDNWYSEKDLHASGYVAETLALLESSHATVRREGALWLLSRDAEDKENVLVRSSGEPTYFASDIAYHRDKFAQRNFDRVIDILGANHHGQALRLQAALPALGIDLGRLNIILYQWVRFVRGDEVLSMGKRKGQFVTLEEVIDAVGADATRFFLLQRHHDSPIDFDLELARAQAKENPVYYIQYAHTRMAGILREAASYSGSLVEPADLSPLVEAEELNLIKKLDEFPDVVRDATRHLSPHFLTGYALRLAGLFHDFYERHRVLGAGDPRLVRARLALVQGAQIVLANSLQLLGIRAPERM